MVSTSSCKISVGEDKWLKQTPKKVNTKINSKAIHSSRKSRTNVDTKDVYEMIRNNNDAYNNVERNIIIIRSIKSVNNQKHYATRFQMKSNKNPIRCTDFGIDHK